MGQDWPGGNQFFLVHLVGNSYTMENVAQGDATISYSAAVGLHRKWVVERDDFINRAFYSDSFNHWVEVTISGVGNNGICVGAVDDTTALIVWASDQDGVHWGLLSGSAWNPASTPLYGGIAGRLSYEPRAVPRADGGLWVGWPTNHPYVILTSYKDGSWGPLDSLNCDYRSKIRPEMRYSDSFQISRDGGTYPAIAWEAFDGSVGAEAVCVSVPTDSGWTTADQIDNDREGMLPTVCRDGNGDVWVAFGRFAGGVDVRWAHTYTKSFASTPIALNQDGQHFVSWVLTEPSPETWWAVLRSQDESAFQSIARVRATNSPAMSYLDTDGLSGDIGYRIRRESVDKRYEWLSDPSDFPVPTLPSLVSASVGPGRVELTWFAAQDVGVARVERRSSQEDWKSMGMAARASSDYLSYIDEGLDAGRFAYRLALDNSQYSAETWVDVPTAYALGLWGFTPNPANVSSQVAFSLASDKPATLEVISVGGRRVLRQEVGSSGAGDHLFALPRTSDMRPGVYWIRLTQSGKSITTKGVLVP